MNWAEWDTFTHVPIKHDTLLEEIRRECEEMETGEFVHRDDPGMEEKWVYNEAGLSRVRKQIEKLESGIEQSA